MNAHLKEFKFLNKYVVNVSVLLVHDSNYGADADGHRGASATFTEDWGHTVTDKKSGKPVKLSKKLQEQLDKIIDQKLDNETIIENEQEKENPFDNGGDGNDD
jgi:hypothetical protein